MNKNFKSALITILAVGALWLFIQFNSAFASQTVTVDGNASDWNASNVLVNGSGNIESLSVCNDDNYIYILVKGTGLKTAITKHSFYFDTDNSKTTGYNKFGWTNSGAEFFLEDNITTGNKLYSYSGIGGAWGWSLITTLSGYVLNDSVLEFKISWSQLALPSNSHIHIGYIAKQKINNIDTEFYTPISGSPMVEFNPIPPTPTPIPPMFTNIPNAIGMAIDDAGWQYMTGDQSRDYTLDDYQTIANVGKNVGTRIMTAWVLGDLDKNGATVNAQYNPPYTPSYVTGRGMVRRDPNITLANDLMELVKNNADYMEFGFHGIGHEHYYYDNIQKKIVYNRAEFAYKPSGTSGYSYPWYWSELNKKMQCAVDIIRQYYDAETCSFPKSFVAPGHGYYYGDGTDSHTTGALMRSYGVKYANGDVNSCTSITGGAIDNGIIYIDRAFGAAYNAEGKTPWDGTDWPYPKYLTNDFGWTEAHFPNYWGGEAKWTEYLKGINNSPDRYLPANTAQCSSQWLYRHYATISSPKNNIALIDTTNIPDNAYSYDLLSTLVLKTKLGGKHISSATIDKNAQIVGYYEDEFDYGYIVIGHKTNTMGRLSKDIYTLTCELGDSKMPILIDRTLATYNIFSFDCDTTSAKLAVEMYGTQNIKIKLPFEPKSVTDDSDKLTILEWSYTAPYLTISLNGKDIQGETGNIFISSTSTSISYNDIEITGLNTSPVNKNENAVKLSGIVKNNSSQNLTTTSVLAVCDKDTGKLVSCKLIKRSYKPNDVFTMNQQFNINKNKAYSYKLFMVDDLKNMKPITLPKIIN